MSDPKEKVDNLGEGLTRQRDKGRGQIGLPS